MENSQLWKFCLVSKKFTVAFGCLYFWSLKYIFFRKCWTYFQSLCLQLEDRAFLSGFLTWSRGESSFDRRIQTWADSKLCTSWHPRMVAISSHWTQCAAKKKMFQVAARIWKLNIFWIPLLTHVWWKKSTMPIVAKVSIQVIGLLLPHFAMDTLTSNKTKLTKNQLI